MTFLFNRHTLCYFPYHLINIPLLFSIRYNPGHPNVFVILSGVAIQAARVGLRPFIHEDYILMLHRKNRVCHFCVVRAIALPLVVLFDV